MPLLKGMCLVSHVHVLNTPVLGDNVELWGQCRTSRSLGDISTSGCARST